MPPFLVCIHDASPAFARETRVMLRDLAPLVGRRLSAGVVPDWHGEWPLAAHPEYCDLLRDSAGELLLHGRVHRRAHGRGLVSFLTAGCDEMNGLSPEATRRTLERGQHDIGEAFGAPARTFLAPGWQRGRVSLTNGDTAGIEHILGFFSLDSAGHRIPLATSTWDCGSWASLGHAGHALGWLLQSLGGRVPSLAIHPMDIERGFWPGIIRLINVLLDAGHIPTTPAALIEPAIEARIPDPQLAPR